VAFVVTGGTGFIGRHLLPELVARGEQVHVLVRPASKAKLKAIAAGIPGARGKLKALEGDITKEGLGVSAAALKELRGAEVFHLAAVYDMKASEEANRAANVEGTRNALDFARAIKAKRFHHVSSIAVAGPKFGGRFTEEMFDEGQVLDQPYYSTKFEAEKLVRASRLPYRIYRPSMVVGSSKTGEMDKIDGPYYFFKLLQRLRDAVPSWVPLTGLEGGRPNLVPVDYVAASMAEIATKRGLDGKVFHIVDPHPQPMGDVVNDFARAAHAPQFTLRVDTRAFDLVPKDVTKLLSRWRAAGPLKDRLLEGLGIPESVFPYFLENRARFTADNTLAALKGSGIECPPIHTYAWKLWDYWERHLDPQAPTERNYRAALEDRVVIVTGASSGIGRAVALECGRHGARVMLVSRTREKLDEVRAGIEKVGGKAWVYPTDLADLDACSALAEKVLAEHGRVDILVNNAGRSIRRSLEDSYDRFHDFQRTMQLNYFGAVKLMLALVPGLREQGSGHVINVSSIGVQSYPPRFGAYVASKSALAALSRCVAPEVATDGVAITNVHMPLVRTPMIAPTGMYKNFPTISPEQAAEMVLNAILTRPPEVSTRLGKLGEAVDTVAPALLNFVMTGAYHVFPDTGGKDGQKKGEEEMSPEAQAMALLMSGVHF